MEPICLRGGIQFYSYRDTRFKQGALSIQFVRPMQKREAALNALLPAVLLRGTKNYPDLRAITLHLDDLYGAAVSALVRRVGDYQTTGLLAVVGQAADKGEQVGGPVAPVFGVTLPQIFHTVGSLQVPHFCAQRIYCQGDLFIFQRELHGVLPHLAAGYSLHSRR